MISLGAVATGEDIEINAEPTSNAADMQLANDVQEQPGPMTDTALLWETHALHSAGEAVLELQPTAHAMSDDPPGGAAFLAQMTEVDAAEGLQSSPSVPCVHLAAGALQGVAETIAMQEASPGIDASVQLMNLQVQALQEADSRTLLHCPLAADKRSISMDGQDAVGLPSMPRTMAASRADIHGSAGLPEAVVDGVSVDADVEAVLLTCILEACGGQY